MCQANGSWLPNDPPVCISTQTPIDPLQPICPSNMLRILDNATHLLCAHLYEPSASVAAADATDDSDWWRQTENCAQFGAERTIFDFDPNEARALADFVGLQTVWLPAHWTRTNRLRWQLPGNGGGQIVQLPGIDIDQAQRPAGHGCAALRFAMNANGEQRMRFMNRPCSEARRMLCVYAEQSHLLRASCRNDRRTTRFASMQSQCYEMVKGPLLNDFEDDLFRMLNEENVAIARQLIPIDSPYVPAGTDNPPLQCTFNALNDGRMLSNNVTTAQWLSAPVAQRPFVNWDDSTVFPVSGSDEDVLVCDEHAHWTIAPLSSVQCALIAVNDLDFSAGNVAIAIAFEHNVQPVLALVIRYPGQLWRPDSTTNIRSSIVYCFHSDESLETVHNVPIDIVQQADDNSFVGFLSVLGPGHYWCEGYAMPSMRLIRSNPNTYYVDEADRFIGTVWRQMDYSNVTIDMPEWINQVIWDAIAASPDLPPFRVDNLTVRTTEFVRPRPTAGEFLRIDFALSVSFTTGTPFVADPKLLVHTSADILRVAAKYERLMAALRRAPFHYPTVNSTVFCMPDIRSSSGETFWPGGRLGEVHTSIEMCWVAVGKPAMRRCSGSADSMGAMWVDLTARDCIATVVGEATQQLYDTVQQFRTVEQTPEVLASVKELTQKHQLVAFDMVSISSIMARAERLNVKRSLSDGELDDMLNIYDSLMAMDVQRTRGAASLNATNILLAALDGMLGNVQAAGTEAMSLGVAEQRAANGSQWRHLQVFLIDPSAMNVSGIALRSGGRIEFLTPQQNIESLFASEADLEMAAFLPVDCLAQLPVLSKLVVCVFDNDILFQAASKHRQTSLRSRIISISIPNVDTSQLPMAMPMFFRYNTSQPSQQCGFWPLDNERIWTDVGIERIRNTTNIVQFNASHLTNFALIIQDLTFSEYDSSNLFLITLVGSALSLVGVLGIFLTALRFSKWRTKASNQLLLQLSSAIAAMLLLFLFVDDQQALANRNVCIAMGATMHYLVLVTFAWMLVMAYLQFMRYVVVFVRMRTDRYVLKLSCISWLVPMVPVAVVLLVDAELYAPFEHAQNDGDDATDGADAAEAADFGRKGAMCYPSGYALYAGLMAPIGFIVVCNLLVFISVIYNLLQVQMSNRSIVLAQLRVSSFLFFLLGLTWVFGFFSRSDGPRVMFAYMFCATATLQGLVLFVYFVVLEPGTRQMWTNDLRTVCRRKRSGSMTVEVNV